MPRLSSTRVFSLFEVAACMAGALTACLSGETIDLGANYARDPGLDSGPTRVPESGADAPTDAPDEEDAGPLDAPVDAPEADVPPLSGAFVCIPDPSFENDPSGDPPDSGPLVTAPPQWQVCSSSAANPPSCTLPPSDGSSYLGLSIGLAPLLFNPASVDATLCEPLVPGVTYLLSLDLALDASESDAAPPGEPPALQVRGSTTACDPQGDLLLRFPPATNRCDWKSSCATFVARQAYSHLVLIPEATSSTGLVFSQTDLLVDNLRSDGTCAPPR
jgi:hypothetical protein